MKDASFGESLARRLPELADMLREKRYIFKTAGNQTDTMLGQSPSLETTGKAERPRDSARKIVDMQIERAGR